MAVATEPTGVRGHPHTQVRQGMDTALLGMLLFIASEIMFFAGLFGAYFTFRGQALVWPPEGFDIEAFPLPFILTVVLVTSSLTMQYATVSIRRGNRTAMNRALAVTLLLGAIFLCGQLYDYANLPFGINSGIYGSLFFTMTGFHGAHVFGGAIGLAVVLARGRSGQFSDKHHTAVEAVHYYWHFVDVVWIALFFTLYFLR
ncbi:MAG: cytochrome c oxidase subunit 3 [Candidatus Limnocylindrales bacterium]